MLSILIVSATPFEIAPTTGLLGIDINNSNKKFVHSLGNIKITFLITGPGMASTAFYLGKELAKEKFNLAVNAGIAGSFDRSLKIGKTIRIKEDCFADLGSDNEKEFLDVFDLGLSEKNEFPFINGKLNSDSGQFEPVFSNIKSVKGITVNTVNGCEEKIKKVKKKYNAQTESMEGAAFFYSCLSENIPCIQIRAISNYVEKRNKESWNIPLAIENLNNALITIIEKLNEPE
jgi:futalosine hydrolase